MQIEKYGGFYVGRYEAGTSKIKLENGVQFENASTSSSWQNGDFVLSKVYRRKNNIYDLAGNMWEWTDEQCYVNNINAVLKSPRGGSFGNIYSERPVCYRVYAYVTVPHTTYGFRPVIYIK